MEKRTLPVGLSGLDAEAIAGHWRDILSEARRLASTHPHVGPALRGRLPEGKPVESVLAALLAGCLDAPTEMRAAFEAVFRRHPGIHREVLEDVSAFHRKDPACDRPYQVLLYYKGFQALLGHRVAHALWLEGDREFAHFLNHASSCRLGVDIHPGARIAGGVFLDHGTGIVIGETAVVARNVSILQGVTLGGTGKESGDRHPKIAEGVLIGAGAKLLGNIKVGEGAKVGAGTVLLHDLPPHVTAVGIPGRVVGKPRDQAPGDSMDQEI